MNGLKSPHALFLNFVALKFFDVLIHNCFLSKDLFEIPFKTIISSFLCPPKELRVAY